MKRLLISLLAGSMLAPFGTRAEILDLGRDLTIELVRVEAGTFTQGSPANEPGRGSDETQRTVELTRAFLLGKGPVTRGQFSRFVEETSYRTEAEVGVSGGFGWDGERLVQRKEFTWRNPGFAQSETHPVTIITYNDARAFLDWLSRKTGRTFALPSEAQWEYAARAGLGGEPVPGQAAWHRENAGAGTKPVGAAPPTPWGFHDLLGNVWEWCEDWYAPYGDQAAADPIQRSAPPSEPQRRVLRGGSWAREAKFCRPAARYRNDPRSRNADNGFRVMTFDVEGPTGAATADPVRLENEAPRNEQPQPDVSPTLHDPAVKQKVVGAGLLGLLVALTAVVGFLFVVFRLVKAFLGRAGSPSGSMISHANRSITPARVRLGEDGFWINNVGMTRGETLCCRYVVGGRSEEIEVAFEPGPEGQFVFTGGRPTSVSVQPKAGGISGIVPGLPVEIGNPEPPPFPPSQPLHGNPPAY